MEGTLPLRQTKLYFAMPFGRKELKLNVTAVRKFVTPLFAGILLLSLVDEIGKSVTDRIPREAASPNFQPHDHFMNWLVTEVADCNEDVETAAFNGVAMSRFAHKDKPGLPNLIVSLRDTTEPYFS